MLPPPTTERRASGLAVGVRRKRRRALGRPLHVASRDVPAGKLPGWRTATSTLCDAPLRRTPCGRTMVTSRGHSCSCTWVGCRNGSIILAGIRRGRPPAHRPSTIWQNSASCESPGIRRRTAEPSNSRWGAERRPPNFSPKTRLPRRRPRNRRLRRPSARNPHAHLPRLHQRPSSAGAHGDGDWQAAVAAFTFKLRELGIEADVDLVHLHDPDVDWTTFGQRAIEVNEFVVIPVSAGYRERWEGTADPVPERARLARRTS
jgi:hypothetical protein